MNIIAFLVLSFVSLSPIDLHSVRAAFQRAEASKANTDKLYNSIKDYDKKDPVLLAYKGAAYSLRAQFEMNRAIKKEVFTQGVRSIEAAVSSAPHNIEIRLIRLIIQENAPKIVKYHKDIEEDRKFIIDNFAAESLEVKQVIRSYAKRSKVLLETDLKG